MFLLNLSNIPTPKGLQIESWDLLKISFYILILDYFKMKIESKITKGVTLAQGESVTIGLPHLVWSLLYPY